jgi:hypothetical protein
MAAVLANTNITLDNTSAITIPGTPSAGQTVLYPKDDKLLYYKDDAGLERLVNITGATTAITKVFTSSNQTITSAGTLTIAHGLGVAPTLVAQFIVCVTAEHGYSIGDVIATPLINTQSSVDNYGLVLTLDATNLNIRFGSAGNFYTGLNKSTGGAVLFTNANWAYRVRAWA